MNIKEFAEKYRVRLNDKKHERKYRISTSEDTVHGRYSEIVDDKTFGSVFAVRFIAAPRSAVMTGALRNRYRAALAGGLTLKRKHGDDEMTFHFNPTNAEQTRLALKRLVGARHRRTVSLTDEQRQAIADRLRNARNRPLATVAA